MPDLSQTVLDLRKEWGLDFARVRCLLTELAVGGTLTELVAASALPRRDVEATLHMLSPFLVEDGDHHTLPGLVLPETSHPDETALTEKMAVVAGALPPSRWRFDHVPATPRTMARRALYLARTYALDGASVLCLGDHDLTSLAVGCVEPNCELTVVDIDELILDLVAEPATGGGDTEVGCRPAGLAPGLPVTAAWADLRLALPPSLVGTADLVFTDPPYTAEGVRLFLTRGLEALRPTGHERLAFCFGTGERHLIKALEVQAVLGDLRLVLEAMLPGFNHYDGAEAIGARSDLYICRPTKGAPVGAAARSTRPGRTRRSRGAKAGDARIYTRGPAAEEAPGRAVPEPVRTAALTAAGDGPALLVGDGWDDDAVPLGEFFSRAAAWATAARPGPFPFTGTPVVNTDPDHGAAALRTLLVTGAKRMVLIVPRRDLPGTDLLGAAYDIAAVPTGPGGDPAVITVTRHDRPPADPVEAVLRHVLLHPGAKVVNSWRDALLALARDAGRPMTKNDARARISADALPQSLRRLRTWELPLSAFRALVAEISRSARAA